jgi:hypothetical protein
MRYGSIILGFKVKSNLPGQVSPDNPGEKRARGTERKNSPSGRNPGQEKKGEKK